MGFKPQIWAGRRELAAQQSTDWIALPENRTPTNPKES